MSSNLDELIYSDTATKLGIDNYPSNESLENLSLLCCNVLYPLRCFVDVVVTSGYRCKRLNRKIGGANSSQHCTGNAIDIISPDCSSQELFDKIIDLDIEFDQIIEEFGRWVHISWVPRNKRGAMLKASRNKNGKVMYTSLGVKRW